MLLVSDLLRVFDEKYEPSRTRVWEIVRTLHPVHCAALLYLLENVKRSRNATPLRLPSPPEVEEARLEGAERTYETAVRPTLNMTRVAVTRRLIPATRDGDPYVYDTRDASGNLTVIGLLHVVRDGAREPLTLQERVALHNLRTHYCTQFVNNVRYFLLPDDMQANRNDFGTVDARSVTEKFLHYYHSLAADGDKSFYYGGYLNPKSFRYVTRSPLTAIDARPADSERDYIVQPLYQGYRVVVNCNERETRCYNCYGELLHGFLYNARFTVNATFEAIVLPVDPDGRTRSWRYGAARTDRNKAHVLVVVDVFRIDHQLLVQSPFCERAVHIRSVGGTHVRLCANSDWDALERSYYGRADLYDPVVGVVVRHKRSGCGDPPRAYRFNMTACYDFLTDRVHRLAGSVTLREFQRVHFNLDMADRRTVCTVYAHDESHYYVCTFDRKLYQFVHCAVLDRRSDVARRRPKYTSETLYVVGARVMPMGVTFMRVYYTERDRTIVGFEQKLTASMYDVPYGDPFLASA